MTATEETLRLLRGSLCLLVVPALLACGGIGQASAQQGLRMAFDYATRDEQSSGRKALWLKGQIAQGDLARLQRHLLANRDAFIEHGERVVLAIDGGDVQEAMQLASFIGETMMQAWLPDPSRARCVSACFFLFAAASSRMAVADSVSIHRPAFDAADLAGADATAVLKRYDVLLREVRDFLDGLLVPRDLTERMLATPWNETYRLTATDLERLGPERPWFEDYSAARCGFEPRLPQRLQAARDAGFDAEVQELREQLDKAVPCVADLRRERRRQILESLAPDKAG